MIPEKVNKIYLVSDAFILAKKTKLWELEKGKNKFVA